MYVRLLRGSFLVSSKIRVYELIQRPQIKKDYSLCDQVRRSARSAFANIAEGFGRFGNKEFAKFVRIAKGSEVELLNHLIDMHDQKLIDRAELAHLESLNRRAIKAAVGLIRRLESTPDPPRPKPGGRRSAD